MAKGGGRIVTCGSSTGYRHQYDNRYLWMRLKQIIGSHGFNYHEAVQTNRLISRGMIHPTLTKVYSLDDVAEATRAVQTNQASRSHRRGPDQPLPAVGRAEVSCPEVSQSPGLSGSRVESVQLDEGAARLRMAPYGLQEGVVDAPTRSDPGPGAQRFWAGRRCCRPRSRPHITSRVRNRPPSLPRCTSVIRRIR
ncbi:hypothetical protein ACU639_30400 [Streptomyces cynarae]|uniref:hypothetical protein n=1 Tax=Streptomyces cynarae TaxID=2981134 RepID=UPI00406D18BE